MNEERLAAARIDALFGVARPAYFASVALSALLLLVLWEALPASLLAGWFGAIAVLTAARFGLQRSYERNPSARAPERWEALFAVGAFGAGALWAFAPAMFLAGIEPLMQMAVIFVVGGSIIGASGVYAASRLAYCSFSVLPLLTVIAQLLLQGGRTYSLLALMVAVFGGVMVRVYLNLHRNVMDTLRAHIENEELVARLASSETRLRGAVDEALGRVTELQRAQDAYAQLAAQEKLVFDTLPVGVAFYSNRMIARCNRRLEQMLGYAAGELLGQSSRILYSTEALWNRAGERYKLREDRSEEPRLNSSH